MSERKLKILVADDDEGVLGVLAIMLDIKGYQVSTALRGEEVLKIKNDLPDLILLDIYMAGVHGDEVCKQLKKQYLTKHIPVILISTCNDIEAIARDAGADDFISKPFKMNPFLLKVAHYATGRGGHGRSLDNDADLRRAV